MIRGQHHHSQDHDPAHFLAHYAWNLSLITDIQLFKEPVFSFLFFAIWPDQSRFQIIFIFAIIHLFGPILIDFRPYSNSFGSEERIRN
jgi:hypothetical protein